MRYAEIVGGVNKVEIVLPCGVGLNGSIGHGILITDESDTIAPIMVV